MSEAEKAIVRWAAIENIITLLVICVLYWLSRSWWPFLLLFNMNGFQLIKRNGKKVSEDWRAEIEAMLDKGAFKVDVIRKCRELSGLPLKDAKDEVEKIMSLRQQGVL